MSDAIMGALLGMGAMLIINGAMFSYNYGKVVQALKNISERQDKTDAVIKDLQTNNRQCPANLKLSEDVAVLKVEIEKDGSNAARGHK
jgi:hypothetical protein